MEKIYLTIDLNVLEKTKKEAKERAEDLEKGNNELLYPDLKWYIDEFYFDANAGKIVIHGEFNQEDEKLGYLSLDLNLDFEMIINIIEEYRKKLGKLKTVLEATK